MNVLFITSNRLGDAVLSTGLINHLISRTLDLRLTIACGAVPAPLFRDTPGVERIIVLQKRSLAGHWFALWSQTVSTFWDLVIDLRASAISWTLPTRGRRIFDTAASRAPSHRVVQLGSVLSLVDAPSPRIWLNEAQRARAAEIMPGGQTILAVGPTSNWGGKCWKAERFAEVISRVTASDAPMSGAHVAVFGAPDEHEMARPVTDSIPPERCVNLVGNSDLLVTAACLEQADLYIGNDSGLMHLAAAMGVPTLGLFGPSREVHYAPWGNNCDVVRTARTYEDIVGDPDYDYRRSDTWMDTLSVDAVEQAIVALWERTRGAGISVDAAR